MQLCYDSNFLEKVLAKMARECQSRGRAEISAAVLEYAGKIELCNRCFLPPSHALTKLTSHTHIHTDICTYTRIQCLLTFTYTRIQCLLTLSHNAADAALYMDLPISDKSFALFLFYFVLLIVFFFDLDLLLIN